MFETDLIEKLFSPFKITATISFSSIHEAAARVLITKKPSVGVIQNWPLDDRNACGSVKLLVWCVQMIICAIVTTKVPNSSTYISAGDISN